jgi:hypothetical protein
LEKGTTEVESDVVGMNENGTRFEHTQSCRDSRIILVESHLSPLLLVSKAAQRVSDNRLVNLVAKKTLLLVHEVAHVDDEKHGRMLRAEEKPKQPADYC